MARFTRTFDPQPMSVRAARVFVRDALQSVWPDSSDGPAAALIAAAELVASELATNAVIHARTPFDVDVHVDGEVRLDFTDGAPAPPRPRSPDAGRPGGRGLVIVEGLASRWGYEEVEDGKRVWCVLVPAAPGPSR